MGYPNLRAEIARAGLSVADVAKAADCSQASVYRWLKCSGGGFDIEQAKAVAQLFPGQTLEYLFKTD